MPYEVTKNVDGRQYRYSVERYRDPESGKLKARWTYLGRVGPSHASRPKQTAAATRERLIDALCNLVEQRSWTEIGPGDIAAAAGVAHGTFYRHFPDRAAVLRAAMARRREALERERPSFEGELGTREAERARLRNYVKPVVATLLERPGLFRAWQALFDESEADRNERARRVLEVEAALAAYFARLATAGIIHPPQNAAALAKALLLALKGVWSTTQAPSSSLPEDMAELFDRAVFGSGPGGEVEERGTGLEPG